MQLDQANAPPDDPVGQTDYDAADSDQQAFETKSESSKNSYDTLHHNSASSLSEENITENASKIRTKGHDCDQAGSNAVVTVQQSGHNPNLNGGGCGACKTCRPICCERGKCVQSNSGTHGPAGAAGSLDMRLEECCAEEKTKCFLVRKSTQLVLSGLFMIGVTVISIADIATDVMTAREYYLTDKLTEFILSLVFLIIPPILLTAGIIRRRDDQTRNSMHYGIKVLIVIANVPFKLYMIWLQMLFSAKCFKRFHKWRMSGCKKQEEQLLEGSLSHFVTDLTLYKLWNSVFESMPQLLLTINVIMTSPGLLQKNEGYVLVASSVFSFGSLCVGIIFYAVTSKEAESQPINRNKTENSASHPLRSKTTVLGCTQIAFMSTYTICYLSSRVISFSYFIIFFKWYAVILPAVHFIFVFIFFTHRRCINKKDTMHRYRLKAYHRQSSSFVYVIVHSIISVFIHVKPEQEELLDQPRYYKLIFYMVYTAENCFMMFLPMLLQALPPVSSVDVTSSRLNELMYYPMTYAALGSLVLGAIACGFYHFVVHKSSRFTREEVFGPCCKCCFGPGGFLCWSCSSCCCCIEMDESRIFITCKNVYTHELRKTSLRDMKSWKQSTESKLLKKNRRWKLMQNAFIASKAAKDDKPTVRTQPYGLKERIDSKDQIDKDPDYPYTMRRSGLHILSDPKGNLFYAPVAELT